jgi:hypothetical protein
MARSVAEYMDERKRECAELSLHPVEDPVYALEEGSKGRRGRIMLALHMTDRAYLAVHEVVEIQRSHVHRLEYAYYLVIDEQEYWSRDLDPHHGYHGTRSVISGSLPGG